jgi:hypothetical protein
LSIKTSLIGSNDWERRNTNVDESRIEDISQVTPAENNFITTPFIEKEVQAELQFLIWNEIKN